VSGTSDASAPPLIENVVPSVMHADVEPVEFASKQGDSPPEIVVVPGVMDVADPPTAEMTPADAVIVVPSTFTTPNVEALPSATAGAASDRMNVVALPFTAAEPAVAVGLAAVAVLTATPPTCKPVQLKVVVPVGTTHTLLPALFRRVRSFVDPCPISARPPVVDSR